MIIFIFAQTIRETGPVDEGADFPELPNAAAQFLPDAAAGGFGNSLTVPRMGTAGVRP